MEKTASGESSLQRGFRLLRAVVAAGPQGEKVTHLARSTGLTQATTHRLLRALVEEGVVVQDESSKRYLASVDFFALAAKAGNPANLRDIFRPVLLRLSATLGDTLFLLVRSGFDAICLDRSEGPIPIRSFTGDVGGRVPLGVGQGALVILAFLPEAEREEVIRFNLPRLLDFGYMDEVYLRTELARVRDQGFASRKDMLIPGMGGVAVPVQDPEGRAIAALSIGTVSERLTEERTRTVVELLRREVAAVSGRINPYDPVLRRPSQAFTAA
jgi:DNA-binding IclR family transcriptional regulator